MRKKLIISLACGLVSLTMLTGMGGGNDGASSIAPGIGATSTAPQKPPPSQRPAALPVAGGSKECSADAAKSRRCRKAQQ